MTTFKSSARFLFFALAAVCLLGPSLIPLLADDAPPPPAGDTRQADADQEPAEEGIEVIEPAGPGCEPDRSVPEGTGDLTPGPEDQQICPATDSLESLFPVQMGPPVGHGYCRCGCGTRCQTSADCGGAACVSFISCC